MQRLAVAFVTLILAFSQPALTQPAPTSSIAMVPPPAISKDLESSFNKNDRNHIKRCGEDKPKKAGEAAESCLVLGGILEGAKHDDLADISFQRSCALGSERGCNDLGKLRRRTSGIDAARVAWSAPPCAHAILCQESLFFAVAELKVVDLVEAERLGMPLCEAGHKDKVCERLQQLGSKKDFAAIIQKHKEERIAELQTGISKEQNNIVVTQGALALAESGLASASGLVQTLYFKGMIALDNSGIKDSQKNIANMSGELAKLGGEPANSGPSLGSMLAGASMSLVANANNLQTGKGGVSASQLGNSLEASPVSAAATAGGSGGGGLYNGPNAMWVHRVLNTAGPYTCSPNGKPQVKIVTTLECQVDNELAKAQMLAWATECEEQTGNHDQAVNLSQNLMAELSQIKSILTNRGGSFSPTGRTGSCNAERVLPINQIP
jgi:hypothetical protein